MKDIIKETVMKWALSKDTTNADLTEMIKEALAKELNKCNHLTDAQRFDLKVRFGLENKE